MSVALTGHVAAATGNTKAQGEAADENFDGVLPLKEKVSYLSTDMAGNLLYSSLGTYIMFFYTDVFGITAAAAGWILLIARIGDCISAPVWGSIVDHTKTKWGQSRPFFLWMAVPFALTVFLAFTAPDLPPAGKVVYATITYILAAGLVYTGIQTPITAILSNLTPDPAERVKANTFRLSGGLFGTFITAVCTLPLVNWAGKAITGETNQKVGFMFTFAVYGVIAVALLWFAFRNIREHNYDPKTQNPLPFKESLHAIKGNWPWITLIIAFVIFWIAQEDRMSVAVYYAKYNLNNENLATVLNGMQILGLITTFLIPPLSKKLGKAGKTDTMILGMVMAIVGQLLLLTASNSFALFVVFWAISILGAAMALAMPFAMLADTVDYGEWKNGIRAAGLLSAVGASFCIQFGSGLGNLIPSKIMAAAGYVANQQQTPEALNAIQFCFIWLPIIVYAICIFIMLFYRRFEKNEPAIRAALADRRAKADAAADAAAAVA
ncbi:MFS transporter [Bifidobacterium reuteri]|uniref:MFS transporter n=1 Tax=Bifidobacterium reuteri TaxID=983706 RepID=A0A5J5E267_9BIFI|nr:MFS transporter [Bifidobacterium reuteri]KAA8823206.1 MFS transporter [Bifidobacterium reuteri]